jgi:hypothetical protein
MNGWITYPSNSKKITENFTIHLNLKAMIQSFKSYHEERPAIYEEFKRYAHQLIARKYKRLSAKLICEVIRYNSMITKVGEFKINNSYASGYARLFEKDFPQYAGYFSKRFSILEV